MSSSSSNCSSVPSSPTWPHHPRSDGVSRKPPDLGVSPSQLVGKVLKHVRRSPNHPTVTLHFADNTVFRILVVGYDPIHRGVPKQIEMDPDLQTLLAPPDGQCDCDVDLTITHAAMITLADKAFQLADRETRWDQQHAGLALKFREDNVWHCVWATLTEYDTCERSKCTFRSYHDVYLDAAHLNPRRGHNRQSRRR